ncbi:hypothetical protein [Sphingomonas sp.]|jgi:hypothetical protein|uniref:hypothetical protein n=1 Tax=Sphingomonas sp. TaxID=28214 RepID=UPI002E327FA1|nr:hypothetical protein [Sphingomonas sp.]HEX4695703.1 hypothetical protein [Sphingomonas sp.]
MDEELVAHIRSRIERCRRLAAATTDRQAAEVLMQIADEGEADLARLAAEHAPAGDGAAQGIQDDPPMIIATPIARG